ncbi:unnamed protein product [Ectocarpus sp. 8 AP-2014]
MIRSLFGLEDVVLYIFVVVRSFFVWIFSTVYSRAMNVPGLSNVLRPLLLPSLAAGLPSTPPEPADVAPTSRRVSANNRVAGSRSAWSTRGRIVEGLLSAVVVVYMCGGTGVSVPYSLATMLSTILTTYVTLGIGGALSELRELHAPSPVASDVFFGARRLRSVMSPVSDEERSDLDGVDLDEYDYFQTLYKMRVFMLGAVGVPAILWCYCAALFDPSSSLALPLMLIGALALTCFFYSGVVVLFYHPFTRKATLGTIFKWHHICTNQPRCRHVRVFLLATGTIYMVLLHVSDVPSKWTWSLIMTHSARLLSLLVALRGDNEGVADAGAEIVEHVQEVG